MSDTFINVVLLPGIVFFMALIVNIIFEIKDRKKKKSVSESDTGKHRKHSRSSRAGRTS